MSKAEERALETYPYNGDYRGQGDSNSKFREAYIKGYRQAEKDLELTCEDVKLLQDISGEVFAEVAWGSVDYYRIYPTQQSFLEEVLKRFKAQKGE